MKRPNDTNSAVIIGAVRICTRSSKGPSVGVVELRCRPVLVAVGVMVAVVVAVPEEKVGKGYSSSWRFSFCVADREPVTIMI